MAISGMPSRVEMGDTKYWERRENAETTRLRNLVRELEWRIAKLEPDAILGQLVRGLPALWADTGDAALLVYDKGGWCVGTSSEFWLGNPSNGNTPEECLWDALDWLIDDETAAEGAKVLSTEPKMGEQK